MLHGSGAQFPSAVYTGLLIMEAQVGQWQAQLAQTQAELQYAIEQIRILTIQVNKNASAAASAATATAPSTTTAPADTTTGSHSQSPKVNYQFGMDIIPSIFDGKQRTDFHEWAENSALYLSTQCVVACEILLEWLVMEKEHVVEAAIRAKCEEEDWEYDSISTFSRVTFLYLLMKTTGTGRKIATSGKRGDGLNAWRREYNPQLVKGAQALLRRALSMGRVKSVADVSDRIQELEELERKYEEHERAHFPQRSRLTSSPKTQKDS